MSMCWMGAAILSALHNTPASSARRVSDAASCPGALRSTSTLMPCSRVTSMHSCDLDGPSRLSTATRAASQNLGAVRLVL